MKRFDFCCLGAFLLSLLLLACQDHEDQLPVAEESPTLTTSPYAISKGEALANLRKVMHSLEDGKDTRAAQATARRLASLKESDLMAVSFPLQGQSARAQSEHIDHLYFVNFEEGGGYAVMAADSRLPDPVLCVTEKGELTEADFLSSRDSVPTEEEIQKYIPGFKFYDPVTEEYYVGAPMTSSNQRSKYTRFRDWTRRYVEDYVGGATPSGPTVKTYGDWKTTEAVNALLETQWHQRWPFNDQYPYFYYVITFVGNRKQAPAGCVPIALAQIMVHNEYPRGISTGSLKIDWKEMKKVYPSSPTEYWDYTQVTPLQREMVGNFVWNIAKGVSAQTSYWFTFATPWEAASFMEKWGYKNVKLRWGRHEVLVKDMLRKNKPVFMSAVSCVKDGHAWVIDGYRLQTRKVVEKTNQGKVLSESYEARYLYHCNFGWEGKCDGYYAAGLYAPKNGPEEREWTKDKLYDIRENYHFKWGFNVITYGY